MSRALIIVGSEADRKRAAAWAMKAPINCRIEFKQAKRSLDQNAHLWAKLTDVAMQAEHNGRKYPADMWKVLFLHAIGREVQFLPALDGNGFIPWGQSSSDLSKAEMTALLDFIDAWGTQNGVVFRAAPEESQKR